MLNSPVIESILIRHSNSLNYSIPWIPIPSIPTRVGIPHRVTHAVAVAVIVHPVVRRLYKRIGTEELPRGRIINAPVHVNDTKGIQVFMTGIAAVGKIPHPRPLSLRRGELYRYTRNTVSLHRLGLPAWHRRLDNLENGEHTPTILRLISCFYY